MITITDKDIQDLQIPPATCVEWIKTSFSLKRRSVMQLYRASTGELLAMIEADWITAMRTGAVAALATQTLKRRNAGIYSFMGLGSTAYATMECLSGFPDNKNCEIRLLRYKDQAEKFAERFSPDGFDFRIAETAGELIRDSDVIISCITRTDELICPDEKMFRPGVLVVPVHTRGFQNCDTVFDKVFADDTDHVRGFANFSRFRKFEELGNVLEGLVPEGKTTGNAYCHTTSASDFMTHISHTGYTA